MVWRRVETRLSRILEGHGGSLICKVHLSFLLGCGCFPVLRQFQRHRKLVQLHAYPSFRVLSQAGDCGALSRAPRAPGRSWCSAEGRGGEEGESGVWDSHRQTARCETGKPQGNGLILLLR